MAEPMIGETLYMKLNLTHVYRQVCIKKKLKKNKNLFFFSNIKISGNPCVCIYIYKRKLIVLLSFYEDHFFLNSSLPLICAQEIFKRENNY